MSRLQAGFVAAALVAVLIAVLSAWGVPAGGSPVRPAVDLGLVLLLVVAALLLAFATRAAERDAGFLLRSGAAEIESGIFLFATLLQDHKERERWLQERVRQIRRRVFERLGRELAPPAEEPPCASPASSLSGLTRRRSAATSSPTCSRSSCSPIS